MEVTVYNLIHIVIDITIMILLITISDTDEIIAIYIIMLVL